jgi:hypothetical protein
MDPDECLKELRKMARQVLDDPGRTYDAEALAELVGAMDDWLRKGGSLPKAWAAHS